VVGEDPVEEVDAAGEVRPAGGRLITGPPRSARSASGRWSRISASISSVESCRTIASSTTIAKRSHAASGADPVMPAAR
jgi:hypothetical protein